MITAGITGGIGSGKSTVSGVMREQGARLINADDVAKHLMQTDEQLKEKLINAFGKQTYHNDGSLNRSYLATQAFENQRVKELNAIVHPAVHSAVQQRIVDTEQSAAEVILYEAAILLQHGRPPFLDHIIVVTADRERRLQWVQRRDDSTRAHVNNRMKTQQNDDELIALADTVIENNGTLAALKQKATMVYQTLLKKAN